MVRELDQDMKGKRRGIVKSHFLPEIRIDSFCQK